MWNDEEISEESPNPEELAENAEAFSNGPGIVSVEDTIASVVDSVSGE